jgi:hypothetical protein
MLAASGSRRVSPTFPGTTTAVMAAAAASVQQTTTSVEANEASLLSAPFSSSTRRPSTDNISIGDHASLFSPLFSSGTRIPSTTNNSSGGRGPPALFASPLPGGHIEPP